MSSSLELRLTIGQHRSKALCKDCKNKTAVAKKKYFAANIKIKNNNREMNLVTMLKINVQLEVSSQNFTKPQALNPFATAPHLAANKLRYDGTVLLQRKEDLHLL